MSLQLIVFIMQKSCVDIHALRETVFKILEEVAPTKMDNDATKIISIVKV